MLWKKQNCRDSDHTHGSQFNAASVLLTNITQVLEKQGTVLAARMMAAE